MYLTKAIKTKMAELRDLISNKIVKTDETTAPIEPTVETALANENATPEQPATTVDLVDVPTEETPAVEEVPTEEEGIDVEDAVKQLIDMVSGFEVRLKAIEDVINKPAEASKEIEDLKDEVEQLSISMSKQNGYKKIVKNDKVADDYYSNIKKQFNK